MTDLIDPAPGGPRRNSVLVPAAVSLLVILAVVVWAALPPSGSRGGPDLTNKALIQGAFDKWQSGTGGPFELLADNARWTIVGSSPVSKTYENKEQFLAEVIRPFNARMAEPLKPTLRGLHADGDTVVVHFDAASRCHDGLPYRNTYAWFMLVRAGRVVSVTAFFDTRLFDDMWTRVAPR
jgi:uncharacterized protein